MNQSGICFVCPEYRLLELQSRGLATVSSFDAVCGGGRCAGISRHWSSGGNSSAGEGRSRRAILIGRRRSSETDAMEAAGRQDPMSVRLETMPAAPQTRGGASVSRQIYKNIVAQ